MTTTVLAMPNIAVLLMALLLHKSHQWTANVMPDPRSDFIACGNAGPAFLCDPDRIMTIKDREIINLNIGELEKVTADIPNQSAACAQRQFDGIEFFLILLDKADNRSQEKMSFREFAEFTADVKVKYVGNKLETDCDTSVVIMLSKLDQHLWTIAGKDTRLTAKDLADAFGLNAQHFSRGDFVKGMINYTDELVKVFRQRNKGTIKSGGKSTRELNRLDQQLDNDNTHVTRLGEDSRQLWAEIIERTMSKCQRVSDETIFFRQVQNTAQEILRLAMKLIQDEHFTTLESLGNKFSDQPNGKQKAWDLAAKEALTEIRRQVEFKVSRGQKLDDGCRV